MSYRMSFYELTMSILLLRNEAFTSMNKRLIDRERERETGVREREVKDTNV